MYNEISYITYDFINTDTKTYKLGYINEVLGVPSGAGISLPPYGRNPIYWISLSALISSSSRS